jgi:hypothetical protein
MASRLVDRLLGRNKVSPVNEDVKPVAKTVSKETAMSVVRRFKGGMRAVGVSGVDDEILKFLAMKGVVVLDEEHKLATINPGVLMCGRCKNFIEGSRTAYDRCKELEIDLPMSGANTTRARSCQSFFLKVLDEM